MNVPLIGGGWICDVAENLWLQIWQKLETLGQWAVQLGHSLVSEFIATFNSDNFALHFWQNLAPSSFSSLQSGHLVVFGFSSTISSAGDFGSKNLKIIIFDLI